MLIEIFESGIPGRFTSLDNYVIYMKTRHPDAVIRKIDITNKQEMSKHKDVVDALRQKGIDALPMVKVEGKIIVNDINFHAY